MSSRPRGISSQDVSSSYVHRAQLVPMEEQEEEQQLEEHDHRATEDGDGEELELGLSLGAKMAAKVGPRSGSCGQWGEYCRILTAKDFPSIGTSRVSPLSSSSSVSSSSSLGGRGGGGNVGNKRTADHVAPSQMVGWPPIRAFRINSLFNHVKDNSLEGSLDAQEKKPGTDRVNALQSAENNLRSNEKVGSVTQSHEKKKPKTFFVKVKMDGMPIGRNVDLSMHRSYETLALTLEEMFQNNPKTKTNSTQILRTSKLLDGPSDFVLTYEDKDGDWMLVGDVPWGMFLSTVRKLRIMRTVDANGLSPRNRSQRD